MIRLQLIAILLLFGALPGSAAEWLQRVPLEHGSAAVALPPDGTISFLQFGEHSYAPAAATAPDGRPIEVRLGESVVIAPFQQLRAVSWHFPNVARGAILGLEKPPQRDAFWDQIIRVDPRHAGSLPRYRLIESGEFGAALPAHVRILSLSPGEIDRQRARLDDPVIPALSPREIPWREIEAKAYPLDFQKVLLASFNDASPAFAFQNGQWFTTWLSRDLPQWNKEDHWFAPALLIGETLVRPAPLSARTAMLKTPDGRTLPGWTLAWAHDGITVRQELFSLRAPAGAEPRVFVGFQVETSRRDVRLALGVGRRINAHYWDDAKRDRTPVPFFTLEPKYHRAERTILDGSGHVILVSAQPFTLEPLGPVEMLAVFAPAADGRICLQIPQTETPAGAATTAGFSAAEFAAAKTQFVAAWTDRLGTGAQARLPAPEWMERIDAWRAQVESITRVRYQGKERLSYGAYFYQAYFGIEEAWPVVALAQWGRGDEAKRQAGIMLEPENLAKDNVHHQSRNGAAPTAAAAVARLTNDRRWLESIAPALIECARWTERVRQEDPEKRSPLTRGLLPPHIYGGDVRDAATSLYATTACWRGMTATGNAFRALGTPALVAEGNTLQAAAERLRNRIDEVVRAVADRSATPPFVPFALELPSLAGRNEGPHPALTATRFGNYWNLFAPSFLELDFRGRDNPGIPNAWIFDYAQTHGGVWAGLPRFHAGLDAAYAIGHLAYLLGRAADDIRFRPQALASLQSFMLHAASRNGHTIPEVAGLFPDRLERAAYEKLVRESPWNFGMYDAQRYLEGHIAFTEPLGAGAGEALWMIRHALLTETRDAHGQPDGGVLLLPAVPADWLADGKEIVLRDFPTTAGMISATIRSAITSRREIAVECHLTPFALNPPPTSPAARRIRIRLAPPDEMPQEIVLEPKPDETHRVISRW